MRLTFHPNVASDIIRIISHYQGRGGPNLATEFHAELRAAFLKTIETPHSYRVQERGLRRVNLPRFVSLPVPIVDEDVRVLVVRHHSRHPSLGTSRR